MRTWAIAGSHREAKGRSHGGGQEGEAKFSKQYVLCSLFSCELTSSVKKTYLVSFEEIKEVRVFMMNNKYF